MTNYLTPKLLSLIALALVCQIGSVQAQEVGKVISSTPVIQQVAVPRQVCTTEQVVVQGQKSGAGAAMGAIAGGAVGNSMGQGSGRAAATMLGLFGGAILGDPVLKMDGQAVFKLAVGVLEETARASLAKAGLNDADIDWLIPHQANIRIITSACDKLGVPMEKVAVVVHETGNTSSASIPLALFGDFGQVKAKDGDLVLMVGFGAGMTAASAVVRWNAQ